ncbi:Cu-processing system permease protein [Halogranum gelatinilyticum]|uniref:Cu-processing system permease protein n=1 Tax=Halogranum gelatinilyticum TaxID=660521 RepID=A0A1G9YNL2_9EURY|nr:ABC transporter permease subunit [Halogranum gelatinilyticum]SDN10587.1 Cu-processing system permease protein [Halogranum gelatinilyticum]
MTDETDADGPYHPPAVGQGTDDDGVLRTLRDLPGALLAALPVGSGSLGSTLTLAHREYRLAARSRWTLGLTLLFAVVSAVVAVAAGTGTAAERVGAAVVSLGELSVYLVPLAALTFGYASVVGPAERGTLDMLFALPVTRSRVVLGVFLGRAVALGAAIAVGFGVGGALLVRFASGAALVPYATLLFAALGVGLAALAVSVLVSTLASEKTHALGGVLLLWVWAVFAHDLLALVLVAVLDVPDAVLTALVLANPVDLFRVVVLASVGTTGGGVSAALATSSLSPVLAATALLAWVLLPLTAAMRLAGRAGAR